MKIVGPPSASRATVEANLPESATALFRNEMLPALWAAGVEYGVDPVGMVAQSAKETGWGSFKGKVQAGFYNTAGIKVRHVTMAMALVPTSDTDHPLVHSMFPSWEVGATAHAQHLSAYANRPVVGLNVDPRFTLVGEPFVETWAELGGRWAPSVTYGVEIEDIMQRLSGGDG